MYKYLAAGASALAAIFMAVIAFLSSRLTSEKRNAEDNAAKADRYESQMEKLQSVQKDIKAVEAEKAPENIPAPGSSSDHLKRLNRLSDK